MSYLKMIHLVPVIVCEVGAHKSAYTKQTTEAIDVLIDLLHHHHNILQLCKYNSDQIYVYKRP